MYKKQPIIRPGRDPSKFREWGPERYLFGGTSDIIIRPEDTHEG